MRNPRLLITAIVLLLLGLVVNHFLQRPPPPQFAPDLQGTPAANAPALRSNSNSDSGLPGFLPVEARQTIALIQRGGPFPHRQDGSTFGNREQQLPQRPRGYYREYTVDTPGLGDRGPRRIVAGRGGELYYTPDHYVTFQWIVRNGGAP